MRKYSKAQETYMLAKANLEVLEAQEKEIDHNYIIENKIKNPDGSTPKYIYCIDDETVFDKANAECSKITEDSGLWAEILEARELLKEAENLLITWGLSRVKKDLPSKAYETLVKGMKEQYTIRCKLIDLSLKVAM